jgi:hypothetical protein
MPLLHVNSAHLTPDEPVVPGDIDGSVNLHIMSPISRANPLTLEVHIEKEGILADVNIPCISNVGSW